MRGVLDGIRVLDLSRYVAGPFCGTILGDMGAEVIRIEPPGGAEDRMLGPLAPGGENLRHILLARNKRSITLDIGNSSGRALFHRLVEQSDVVLESYSPPAKEKLGLTHESLSKLKPDIILVSVSAFGGNGPDRGRLGFDPIAQAESGAMSFTGFPDGPPTRSQLTWVDLSTAVHAALGSVLALMHRDKTGEGQWVELALLDTAVSYVSFLGVAAEYEVLGLVRPRLGNSSYFSFSDCFAARDGTVLISVVGSPLWRRLASLVGRPELADDPRFADDSARYENRERIVPLVQQWVSERSVDEVMAILQEARIPCGRVNEVAEMIVHPQVAARNLLEKREVAGLGQVNHPRVAIRMNRTPLQIREVAHGLGEDNYSVYSQLLGLSEEHLASLQAEGVI